MRLVLGEDRRVAMWAEAQFPRRMGSMSRSFRDPYYAIGVESRDQLTGAFVFTNYDGNDVNVTVAGRGAVSRTALRGAVKFAFDDLGCSRVSVTTRADNARVIDMVQRVGFVREGYLRRLFGNADGVLLGLLEKDFRL